MKHLLVIVLSLCVGLLAAQEVEESAGEAPEELKRNKINFVLGHTHIPGGISEEGNKSWLVLASWGIDYDYYLSHNWTIGLHSDMVLENFEIGDEGAEEERSRPVAFVLTGGRHWDHFALFVGGGMEFAKEENLALARVGVDYGWELPKEWEVSLSLVTDLKFGAYNSWVFGIGIGKLF